MTSIHAAAAEGRHSALVFIHGFLDGAAAWDDTVQALGERASGALCVDLPGMGSRAGEPGPYSLDGYAEDVARQVRALDRPVILIGHSMGALVAEMVAVELPSQVRALVLLTPVPLAGTNLPDEAIAPFRALGGNPGAQREVRRQLSHALDDTRLEKLGRLGDAMTASATSAIADVWNRGHARGASHAQYAGPVLVVRGEADPFVTAGLIEASVAPRFDQAVVARIAEAGHWPHVEQPQALAGTIAEFLATVEGAAGAGVAQQGWTRAFEAKSSSAFADAFAADIVLEASVLARPVVGVEQVKTVMGTASKIYETLAFTSEATIGQRSYLEWEAQAFGGERLYGVTVLTKDEQGRIVRAAIHHRPLGAALRFSAELGHRLQGQLDANYFHRAN